MRGLRRAAAGRGQPGRRVGSFHPHADRGTHPSPIPVPASVCPLSQISPAVGKAGPCTFSSSCTPASLVEDALVAAPPGQPGSVQGMGVHDNKRSVSNERHMTRGSIARSSINPLTLLVGAIGNAVEHVANSVEHSEGFRTLVHKCAPAARQTPLFLHRQGTQTLVGTKSWCLHVAQFLMESGCCTDSVLPQRVSREQTPGGRVPCACRENRLHDKSWDSDDEDLKKGLAKQDSLEFTRARLAKQREQRKIETLRQLAQRADVDSVIDENVKVSRRAPLLCRDCTRQCGDPLHCLRCLCADAWRGLAGLSHHDPEGAGEEHGRRGGPGDRGGVCQV